MLTIETQVHKNNKNLRRFIIRSDSSGNETELCKLPPFTGQIKPYELSEDKGHRESLHELLGDTGFSIVDELFKIEGVDCIALTNCSMTVRKNEHFTWGPDGHCDELQKKIFNVLVDAFGEAKVAFKGYFEE